MSFGSELKNEFEKSEALLKKLFTTTTWEKTASTTLLVLGPAVETLVTIVAGQPAEKLVAAGITDVQVDLAAATSLINGANVAGTSGATATVANLLTSVTTNLTQIESAAEIKDPATKAKFTAAVTGIVGSIQAILQAAAPIAAAAKA